MQSWQRDVLRIELPAPIELPEHQHPYLVALSGIEDPWLKDSLDMALAEAAQACRDGLAGTGRAAWRVGGWLQSSGDAQSLAETLADAMQLTTEVQTPARYLRLADRRTLDWLTHLVGVERLRSALPGLRRWVWLDSLNHLQTLEGVETGGSKRLRIRREEWPLFERAQWVHPTLARWRGESESGLGSCRTAQVLPVVSEAVHLALRARTSLGARLSQDDDLIAWAVLHLLHPEFRDTGVFKAWLRLEIDSPDFEPLHLHCHKVHQALLRATAA